MEQLRRKIFWSIELSAVGILAAVLVVFNAANYAQYQHVEWKMLQQAAVYASFTGNGLSGSGSSSSSSSKTYPSARGGRVGKESSVAAAALASGKIGVIRADSDGSILADSGFVDKMKTASEKNLLRKILKSGEAQGKIGAIRYVLMEEDGTYTVACVRESLADSGVPAAAGLSLAALLAAALVFALFARTLARRISRPAEEAMKAQKQFIADASHELKTPVAVIDANIAVLEKEIGPNKWMGYIKEEGGRLNALVQDLLQLSRIDFEEENQKSGTPAAEYSLSDLAEETALPFESVAFEQGIAYTLKVPENLHAWGNPDDARHILGILLDNAFRNTESGGAVVLDLSGRKQKDGHRKERGFAVITVENTGEGISEEDLPHLFDRFYKSDKARTYKGNNFGLGLAIAKSLTERNGGTIAASSEGELVRFRVSLPQEKGNKRNT